MNKPITYQGVFELIVSGMMILLFVFYPIMIVWIVFDLNRTQNEISYTCHYVDNTGDHTVYGRDINIVYKMCREHGQTIMFGYLGSAYNIN